MDLIQGCGHADVWVEPAARSSNQVHRNRKRIPRVSRFESVDTCLDHSHESRIQRSVVRAGGAGQSLSIERVVRKCAGGRETSPKIFGLIKLLANQFGANGLSI